VIEANSVARATALIVLGAGDRRQAKGAGAPTQTVKVSGTISASGKQKGPRAAASW